MCICAQVRIRAARCPFQLGWRLPLRFIVAGCTAPPAPRYGQYCKVLVYWRGAAVLAARLAHEVRGRLAFLLAGRTFFLHNVSACCIACRRAASHLLRGRPPCSGGRNAPAAPLWHLSGRICYVGATKLTEVGDCTNEIVQAMQTEVRLLEWPLQQHGC
jgi:hypothetical protein